FIGTALGIASAIPAIVKLFK
uniref:M-poneritoxin-Ng1f n=1 Tax=Neoponera goeldii TaxID=3057131 RepID=WTX1F_NEOGO|nr:RecName: Full=M-poneritoxin-Ng1f; Short=M-PONTX-Ng1f; AltName: Full=Poneratoxin; AltName: Full=Ponericin-W6 [Neoponera goeldii]